MPRLRSITVYWSILTRNSPWRPTIRMLIFPSLILGVFLLTSQGKGEIIDRIVAVVNDEIITLSELERFRESFYPRTPKKNDWLSKEWHLLDSRRQALDALIEEKLIDQEADRQNINVTQKELKETLESLRRQQGLSRSQLEQILKAQDLTYETYSAEVEKGLRRTRLINRIVKSKIEIREKNLRTYYQTHMDEYMADESIRISHLLLPLSPDSTKDKEEATFSRAKDILTRVQQGEDFATLAHECSMNTPGAVEGDLGYFKRGELIPSIEKRAFSPKVGEVAGPIRTPEGIVLIKVTEKRVGSPIPFAKIKKRVEEDYYRSEIDRRYRQWLNRLRRRSFIEVKL